ncbi:MAG: anti-sigma factor [Paracoccaceae bacterium]|nr:anti-sigma factor [Paracoccaceae bacterium]
MSEVTPYTPREDDSLLAAEYVLRLLDPAEEARVAARLAREPALAAAVAAWTARLSGLDAEVIEATPRAAVKVDLERRLFGLPQRAPFWQRAGLWQAVSLASLAVAGFLAVQSLQLPEGPARAPLFVSEIAAEDQSLRLLAVYDSAAAELRVTRTAGDAAEGRVLQLWAIAGDAPPVSLGVLPSDATTAVILPDALRAGVADLVLAVSDEPPGGSPTGLPTGAVLAVGQVNAL